MSNDWEVVQEKAFTAWVNGVLEKVGTEKIHDISTDFSDGIKLVKFLESLSDKKIDKKKLVENPKSRIQYIQNLYLALKFTESLDVKAEGVSAEDFADCNKKLILGFLWTLYRKYRIAVIKEGDKSDVEGLLLWCKNTTSGYAGVDLQSFKFGFRDGRAFLALAHKYDPAQFDYDALNADTPEVRLEKAFEIAEKTMNIPKLLDIGEVMKGNTDERSLTLYASLFFHAFSAKAQREALEGLESSLSSAQHSREELLRQLSTLEKAKGELTTLTEEKDKRITSLSDESSSLKSRNGQLEAELAELRAKLGSLEGKFTELDATHTKEHEELVESKSTGKELTEKVSTLNEKVSTLTEKLQTSTTKVGELETKLADVESKSDKQSTDLDVGLKRNEELTNKLAAAESEREALKEKLAQAQAQLEETTKRADAEFSALLLLRQQFDQHVLDMHRWRKLVEVDSFADFGVEVKAPLLEELQKNGAFDAQVTVLRGKLEDETKDIQKYLVEKEEFNKQKLKK